MLLAPSIQEPSKAALGVYGGRGDPEKNDMTRTTGKRSSWVSQQLSAHCSGISESASPGNARTFGMDFHRALPPIFDETVEL